MLSRRDHLYAVLDRQGHFYAVLDRQGHFYTGLARTGVILHDTSQRRYVRA